MPAPKGHPPYPGCETGGRPRKYTEEFLCELAEKLDVWIENENNLWIKYFFLDNKLDPEMADEFCSYNEKFRLSYKKSMKYQEGRMFNGALINKFNANITKFGLMNNHGWSEKSEQKISGDANNPLNVLFNHSKELIDESKAE